MMTIWNFSGEGRKMPDDASETSMGESLSLLAPTLREDTRTRARLRIIQGALTAVAASGLEVTTEEVAEAAGVSRRTVTRHFATHSEMILATIVEVRRLLDLSVPEPPLPGADVETWLTEAAVATHELNRKLIGRAFWDLYVDRPGISAEVANSISDAMEVRRKFSDQVASAAWGALGGVGAPPTFVLDSFLLQLSGFATNALPHYSAQETGRLSAHILWLVLSDALGDQGVEAPTSWSPTVS
jgi:AcrR family transcriptional regulator